ncbi:MAG: ABC transporter permease [Saprospiraceae bacterium]|nr:ABC transporter permease [Saprospiraceae bacterium]
MMIFKLAWRNIWRNRRRTLITAASILFAVLFASFMEALQKGAWNNMISNVVNFYFGYVQIHEDGYWEEQSLEKSFQLKDSMLLLPEQFPAIKAVIPRIESFALASTGEQTMGTLVVGIDPDAENQMTGLQERLTTGNYIEAQDQSVLIAEGVAENLKLGIGDTLLLISQGYHGVNAAGKYPVAGIVSFASPELNKQLVYLPLAEAQWFYGAEGMITSLALKLDNQGDIAPLMAALPAHIDTSRYEVMDWKQMMPDLLEAKALDSAGNVVVYFILYMIIGFGILGTILMMTKERMYEFGILTAIGMKRALLSISVWLEILLLAMLGSLAGILVSMPIVWYFKVNPIRFGGDYASTLEKFGFEPIFPAEFDVTIFLMQAMIVLILTAILALYPIWKIYRLKAVEAMRD